ncbi:hypothetical protein F320042A7_51920 [Blautia producta]|uniref:Uncharacterized protein n=1 Tax=Blautia producta TaxID=33035 RepID=A0A7G5MP47_9FIRM|nr:hypothetical protein E5259_01580 [Blautia producta]
MFQWSAREIHLPQLLNEEALADEFSKWEQVSSMAAERFAPRLLSPQPLSRSLPSTAKTPKKAATPVIPHTICKIPGPAALCFSIMLSHASVKTHGHLRETS